MDQNIRRQHRLANNGDPLETQKAQIMECRVKRHTWTYQKGETQMVCSSCGEKEYPRFECQVMDRIQVGGMLHIQIRIEDTQKNLCFDTIVLGEIGIETMRIFCVAATISPDAFLAHWKNWRLIPGRI